MSDQPSSSPDDSQLHSGFVHSTAREVAVQAAINMLLDQHGPTGKTHVDIIPSEVGVVRMLSHHEGGAVKADTLALGNVSRKEEETTFDVIQGTGPRMQKPQVRETKQPDGTTLVQAAGLGRVETTTRTSLLPKATVMQSFDAAGDVAHVWGKNCSSQQICYTATLDKTGKIPIGIAKFDLLKDSPESRLLRVDVFKFGPNRTEIKVGDFHLLERHLPSGNTSLDINAIRVPKHEK
jgi:hypothetical protein